MKGLIAGLIAVGILALVVRPPGGDDAPKRAVAKAPRAAAISSSGSLSHKGTRDGMPVFRATNAGPGTIVEGSVTIANAGRASGYFSLSQADLTDVASPNGGTLSRSLSLDIEELRGGRKPVKVYSGPFAGMDIRPLGFIRPGTTRKYRFTATVEGDDGGSLDGSSTSARYVWNALEGAPPSARERRKKDLSPPRVRVSFPKVQRLLAVPYLAATARCNEDCRLAMSGRVGARPTRSVGRRARAGRNVRLRVRIPRRTLRAMRRRLMGGRRVTIRLVLTAHDLKGNRAVVKRTVRLKPRPR